MHIRGLWEEKGSSDTRLLEGLFLPDDLTVVGRSHGLVDGAPYRREHVVPRKVIIDECHAMLGRGDSDEFIARFIRDHTRIVLITPEEAEALDQSKSPCLKQAMPVGWAPGGGLYRRLDLMGIKWSPIACNQLRIDES